MRRTIQAVIILVMVIVGMLQAQPTPRSDWIKTFDYREGSSGNCVRQTSDKGFIIVGDADRITVEDGDTITNVDVYLIKTDSLGNQLWQKTFGGSWKDEGYSVQQTNDGGYIITGMYYDTTDDRGKVYFIKLQPDLK